MSRSRPLLRRAVASFAAAIVVLNAVAAMHAWRMCHFTTSGVRTPPPHTLTLLDKLVVLLSGVRIPKPQNHGDPSAVGLPFEIVRFPGYSGIQLEAWFVKREGALACAVLFPGYASPKASLLKETKVFHELGFNVLVVDFYGAGGSAGEETSVGFHESDDVLSAVMHVRVELKLEPVILFGESMGAAAVLRAASRRSDLATALIIESPFATLLSAAENRFDRMGLPSSPFAHLLVFWGGLIAGIPAFEHEPTEYARRVSLPTLVLHGSDDSYAKPADVKKVFQSLRGRRTIVSFDKAAHVNLIDHDNRLWRGAVTDFVRREAPNPQETRQLRTD